MAILATEAQEAKALSFVLRMKRIDSLKKEFKEAFEAYTYFQSARSAVQNRIEKTSIKGYRKVLLKKFNKYNIGMSKAYHGYNSIILELSKIGYEQPDYDIYADKLQ